MSNHTFMKEVIKKFLEGEKNPQDIGDLAMLANMITTAPPQYQIICDNWRQGFLTRNELIAQLTETYYAEELQLSERFSQLKGFVESLTMEEANFVFDLIQTEKNKSA